MAKTVGAIRELDGNKRFARESAEFRTIGQEFRSEALAHTKRKKLTLWNCRVLLFLCLHCKIARRLHAKKMLHEIIPPPARKIIISFAVCHIGDK